MLYCYKFTKILIPVAEVGRPEGEHSDKIHIHKYIYIYAIHNSYILTSYINNLREIYSIIYNMKNKVAILYLNPNLLLEIKRNIYNAQWSIHKKMY